MIQLAERRLQRQTKQQCYDQEQCHFSYIDPIIHAVHSCNTFFKRFHTKLERQERIDPLEYLRKNLDRERSAASRHLDDHDYNSQCLTHVSKSESHRIHKAEIIKNAQANYPITLTDAEKALLIATAQSTATQTAINTALATAKTTAEQTAVATAVAVAQKVATETAETTAVETAQQIATQTAITTALTTAQSTATTTAMQTSTTVAKQVGNQAKKTFTNQVVSQMNTLGNGLNQLTSGLSQLNEGANTLANGTNQVNDGASTLADGTNQVNDGATTLAEGIKTFNEEGIKKICNYINGDVKDLTTRVQKLTDLSKEYNNFTMLDGENDGEVKFIMIADAVKKQEDSEQNKEEAVLSTNVINEENK